MHEKMGLTHTDLKPENILLKLDTKKQVIDQKAWPIQVQRKKDIYQGEKMDESDEQDSYTHEQDIQGDGCTGGMIGGNRMSSNPDQGGSQVRRFK